jgi:tRNA (guanine9-N1)-methyltransferase
VRKKEKKALEKQKHKAASEIKKVKAQGAVQAMNAEEFAVWKAQKEEKINARTREKSEKKERMTKALQTGQRIVIDLEFPHLMSASEQRSMAHQISYSYSANAHTSTPAHLILSGVEGTIKDHLTRSFPGHQNWIITTTEKSYLEYFSESKADLVYLTADSPDELQSLDPGKIYIVGGIVDRNRHKNLCYNKAVEQGIATARLPIGESIKLASSAVMCTNHVVEIMLKWMEMKDWKAAFTAVVPTRKRKADGDVDGEEEGGKGDGNKEKEGEGGGDGNDAEGGGGRVEAS